MPDCDHYLVIDLEATCDDQGSVPPHEMEIIEIGAVMVESRTFTPADEREIFIRPVRHPRLTEFCTGLTSIQQSDVDSAPTFPDAFAQLTAWMKGYGELLWCSWGNYDQNQLRQDCQFHGLAYTMPEHLNLKAMFREQRGLRKPVGMARALKIVELELEGTHHRGIDDARNIARLLPHALGVRS